MPKGNNKLQESFVEVNIIVFNDYYNLTLTISKDDAKQPEHLGTYQYKSKSKAFVLEKINIFKDVGYSFTTECQVPEFRLAMGLKN